jgi:hypothetical protein
MPVHVCVVRRNGVESQPDPGNAEYADGCQNEGPELANQQPSPPGRLTTRWSDHPRRFGFMLSRKAFAWRAGLDPTCLSPIYSLLLSHLNGHGIQPRI